MVHGTGELAMKRGIQTLSIMTLLSLAAAGCTDRPFPGDDEVGDTSGSDDESSSSSSSGEESTESTESTEESSSSSSGEESTESTESTEESSSSGEESTESTESTEESSSGEESTESTEESSSGEESTESTESTEESSSSGEESTEESSSSGEESTEEADTILDTEEEGFDTFFIPPSDINPFDECDPFLQDCPEGDKCSPFASQGGTWDANKCVPILGDNAPGDLCQLDSIESGLDDCDGSSYCFTDVCVAFCEGTEIDPICPPGSECQIANEGSITLCIPSCDPLLQDCAQGQGCFFDGDSFLCAPTTEDIPLGEACGFINDCAAGSICVFGDALPACVGEACCTAFCDMLDPVECAAVPGTSCVSFGDGFEPIGLCVIP